MIPEMAGAKANENDEEEGHLADTESNVSKTIDRNEERRRNTMFKINKRTLSSPTLSSSSHQSHGGDGKMFKMEHMDYIKSNADEDNDSFLKRDTANNGSDSQHSTDTINLVIGKCEKFFVCSGNYQKSYPLTPQKKCQNDGRHERSEIKVSSFRTILNKLNYETFGTNHAKTLNSECVKQSANNDFIMEPTSACLGLTILKTEFMHHLSSCDLPFETKTDIRVNFLETRIHPQQIQGIPWRLLNNERYRLMTFVKFPIDSQISTIHLASKGFSYIEFGSIHKIICFFCISQLERFDDAENIDSEHRRLGMDCPMVKGTHCSNVSIKNQCPSISVDEIFAQLLEYRKNEIIPIASGTTASSGSGSNNARSSQPSDERAKSVIVTNTSDLAESDGSAAQNTGQHSLSSQLMEDTATPQEQVQSVTTASEQIYHGSATAESSAVVEEVANVPQQTQPKDSSSDATSAEGGTATPSYEKLGIITARPKRVEYAVYSVRMGSYNEWPKNHHIKPEDLSKAGYFYTGYSDCARCFYCGGGLRNWEVGDDVWVEHARWFPKCAFLLQEVGKEFIEAVQILKDERDQIKYADVIKRMETTEASTPLKFREKGMERDPAVLSVIDNGFDKPQIVKLAQKIRKAGEILSSDKLYEAATRCKIPKKDTISNLGSDSVSIRRGGDQARDKEMVKALREENNELRQQTTCKICMDTEVAVVFLPCGHLVSCTECSCALTSCPVCRLGIKGIVRAYVG